MSNKIFDVVVIATMRAGKSTLINALIGTELLSSANEATTATITRIHDKDYRTYFSGKAYQKRGRLFKNGKLNINPNERKKNSTRLKKVEKCEKLTKEILSAWNLAENIDCIDIVGNISALNNGHSELVIYDTPGPNNSQDDNHEALTMEVINDGNFGLILYVLNATQLGVNDDLHLLENIKKSLDKYSHKDIIFLLNKADSLDPQKGEELSDVVGRSKKYLTNIGFAEPTIIPISANYALLANKALNGEPLTRRQRADLTNALDIIDTTFIKNATVDMNIKNRLFEKLNTESEQENINIGNEHFVTKQSLIQLVIQSGLGIITQILDKKINIIDKY
ncbi:hypothetical protein A4G19_06430 [Pasteurellaceae bacterium Macca]|nr:hypothetical protein [Pasteurellaceae bacterium Macca]